MHLEQASIDINHPMHQIVPCLLDVEIDPYVTRGWFAFERTLDGTRIFFFGEEATYHLPLLADQIKACMTAHRYTDTL